MVVDLAAAVTSVEEGVIQVMALAVVVGESLTSQADPRIFGAELRVSQDGLARCQ